MKFSDPFHAAVPLNILNELVDLLSLLEFIEYRSARSTISPGTNSYRKGSKIYGRIIFFNSM